MRDRWVGRGWTVAALLAAASLVASSRQIQPPHARAVRLTTNPLITVASSPSLGDNVDGPTVIRVPDWVERPLGRYYMYFAHHWGTHIRLAYADTIGGPWRVHEPGVLHVKDTGLHRPQRSRGAVRGPGASPGAAATGQPTAGVLQRHWRRPRAADAVDHRSGRRLDGMEASPAVEVLRPETAYECADLPIVPSTAGGIVSRVRELRHPYLFEDGPEMYLFYSICGEQGIAVARLTLE